MLLLEDRRFYCYIYLNPLKSGTFIYNEFCFAYEPFYVGKGKGNRIYAHLEEAKTYLNTGNLNNVRNLHKIHTIIKIWKEIGIDPIIVKIRKNLTSFESGELEKYLISIIGRSDIKTGCLTNLTSGGDGVTNRSKESLEISTSKFKETIKNNPEIVANISYKRSITLKNNPEIQLKATIKRKNTIESNPDITKNANKKRKETELNNPDIQIRRSASYQNTIQQNPDIIINREQKKKKLFEKEPERLINRGRKVFEGHKKRTKQQKQDTVDKFLNFLNSNPNKKMQMSKKSKESRIRNRSACGINNSSYKAIDISIFLNLYFDNLSISEICMRYFEKLNIEISGSSVKRILDVLSFPRKGVSLKSREKHNKFISENKHKKQWYIDNYKRLEEEYFDRKFKEKHPDVH